ncbi:MAG: glycosyltransferase family 39 protein [Anaerolineales bacterium]|nr:glycosyltransferase family 39 protein [Anaerolineales bacterium]
MNSNTHTKTSEVFSKFWPWFFFAAAFQSLLAAAALLTVPSEGLSLARLALFGAFAFIFLAGMYLGFTARRDVFRFDRFARTPIILTSALLPLTSSLLLFLLRYLNPERLLPYYERMSPLLWLLFVLGAEAVIFLLLIKNGFHPQEFSKRKPVYISALAAFCLLLSVFLFVSITRIGITPDTAYWGEPGVAIMGWQFALSILIGFAVLLAGSPSAFRLPPSVDQNSSLTTYFLPIALYLTAALLWLSVPVEVLTNSFYAPSSPPLNTPLPYSDAGYYDYASQSLLIGSDYFGGIPPRPLYVTFLAFLHFLFGQNYPAIIAAQTLALALFPVALYFLAKKLHSPAAGVTVALFAIFRELVGLWISSNTRVANSKIFITDFPTALGIVAMCLVIIWWLERRDFKSTLAAGGAFGLFLLFRTQSMLTLPVVFVLAWFAFQRKTVEWIKAGIVFGVTMLLAVLPWLTHNYMVTGAFSFDDPKQVAVIYSQYSFTDNLDLNQFDPERDSVRERILSFTLENPAYVATFFTTHFLNTEIGGLLALPLIKPFNGLQAPVNLYWMEWDGSLEWYNVLLLLVYLAILAVGFGTAWRRMGWLGLVPLAFNLGYAISNGIARFSSWRYNLPVDWVIYFYFAIGAIEILGGLSLLFGAQNDKLFPQNAQPKAGIISFRDFRFRHILIALAFMLVGSLPWLAKGFAQPRYTSTQDELVTQLVSSGYDHEEIQKFLTQPDAVLMEGRMLYPRLYRRNAGLSSANPWPAYAIQDFPRIGFILINNDVYNLYFPTRDLLGFSQGADSVVLACDVGDGLFEARVVAFENSSYQSAPLETPCANR